MTRFEGVIGHRRVIELLERELESPAAAYLFVGASGVGKGTVARRFATLLLCPEVGHHADDCRSCRRAGTGSHPDLVMVEPEGRQTIGVDQARTTVTRAMMMPVEGDRKVFLVEDAGAMTEQAANALLKTLEEPTPSTMFILATEAEDDLPTTVASRCRKVHFGRVPEDELVEGLVGRGVDQSRARELSQIAGGKPGLALALLSSPQVAEFRESWLALPGRVTDRPGEAFGLAGEMLGEVTPLLVGFGEEGGQDDRARRRARQALLVTGLEILASWYVDAAALQLGGSIRNRDVSSADLTAISPARAVGNAELVMDAVVDLEANLRPQLLLAALFTALAI